MEILRASYMGLFLMGALSLAAACGSEVNGGSGGSAGTGATGGTGGTGGDPLSAEQACNDLCHKLETANCTLGGDDCMTSCADYMANVPPECEDEVAAQFSCAIPYASPTCDDPQQCEDERDAASACIAMFGCSPESTCFGGGGPDGESCGCDEVCKTIKYSTNCTTPSGATMTTCDCLINDMSVGTCQMTDPGSCGPKTTCCNAQYFHL